MLTYGHHDTPRAASHLARRKLRVEAAATGPEPVPPGRTWPSWYAARLAAPQPAAEAIPPGGAPLTAPCDATASGSEDAQVMLARGALERLFFCGHHFREFALILYSDGWRVTHDNRVWVSDVA